MASAREAHADLALAAVGTFFLIPISGSDYFGLAQQIFLTVILTRALTIAHRGASRHAGHDAESSAAAEPNALYASSS